MSCGVFSISIYKQLEIYKGVRYAFPGYSGEEVKKALKFIGGNSG